MALEPQRERLSELLQRYRTQHNLSQRKMATRFGLNPTSLLAYLDGTAYPLPDTREKIARALGKTPAELEAYLNEVQLQSANSLEQIKQDIRALSSPDFLEVAEVVFQRLLLELSGKSPQAPLPACTAARKQRC